METSAFLISEEQKKKIIIEEKLLLRNRIARLRSKEIDMIFHEESPFYKRKGTLTAVLEVLFGVYTGIISVIIVLMVSRIF